MRAASAGPFYRADTPFVLASASPRRRELLGQLGIVPDFCISPDIDETPQTHELPRAYVRRMSHEKMLAAKKEQDAGSLILAADTIVAAGRRLVGKPETRDAAQKTLSLLSGRRHRVFTAVTLFDPKTQKISERVVETAVGIARLTPLQLERLLDTAEWQGKAGAYAIQGYMAAFVSFISGSYTNVVGLPLYETAQLLRGCGYLV